MILKGLIRRQLGLHLDVSHMPCQSAGRLKHGGRGSQQAEGTGDAVGVAVPATGTRRHHISRAGPSVADSLRYGCDCGGERKRRREGARISQ